MWINTVTNNLQVQYETISVLKERLKKYGESTSGNKDVLVQRLKSLMDAPAPYLGVGSYYHFNKKETTAKLEKFCKENHIMFDSRYTA